MWNGQRTPSTGLAGTAGFSDEQVEKVRNGELTYTQTRPSGWTPALRLQDMDTDGIDVSVLYPTMLLGLQSVRDVEFGRVQARVYNDWCADHLKEGQGRLYGAGALPPMHDAVDVQGVVDEIHHVAELPGMVSVFMRPNPAIEWRYFNDPVYDPIWSALQDAELPVAFHPFLAPDLPGACNGLKLARLRNPDGSYQTLEDVRGGQGEGRGGPRGLPSEHLFHAGDRQPRRCDERDLLHHRRRCGRTLSRREVHVPRGERGLAHPVARAARPPREEVQLGRALAEDAAVGVLPPAMLDQLRPRRVDARVHSQLASVRCRPHHLGVRLSTPRRQVPRCHPGTHRGAGGIGMGAEADDHQREREGAIRNRLTRQCSGAARERSEVSTA